MKLDLSPERPVSCRSDMTLGQLILRAQSPRGLPIFWKDKDHRLLRTAKVLARHNMLEKIYSEPGVTIFKIAPGWAKKGHQA